MAEVLTDPKLDSEVRTILWTAIDLDEQCEPLRSQYELGLAQQIFLASLKPRHDLENQLRMIGQKIDLLPLKVQKALRDIARIMRGHGQACVTVPDVACYFANSDLRTPAWQGLRALTAAKPENQNLYSWADESKDPSPKQRTPRAEANIRVREYLKQNKAQIKKEGRLPTQRQIASVVGCAVGIIGSLSAYKTVREELEARGIGRKGKKPKAVRLSEKVEAITGREDVALKQLMGEHEADYEPSPLDVDPPDRRRKVIERKQM